MIRRSKRILVLTGAGISASCGIPTFRGKGDFYDTVAREFDLPDGSAIMDAHFFRDDPRPFFKVARRLYPSNFSPSAAHRFLRRLDDSGKLLRDYTQNVDTLERVAGVRSVVYCHGSFSTAVCTRCDRKFAGEYIEDEILSGTVPRCRSCDGGVIKPSIVFFNEMLPRGFYHSLSEDAPRADLLLVMGTSLSVAPVSHIPAALRHIPSVFINAESVSACDEGLFDVFVRGACDDAIRNIERHLQLDLPGRCP
ncbi:DHS-like NAD/FAD-binding domain-containing protein [Baffinella frigidus]|nr:DHS-like NAD/FAD-binding domain-containing protein [Cryptophyta sp. CCMP2293]